MTDLASPAHTLAVLALLLLSFILFSRDRIPIQFTSLFVLVALAVGFYVWPFRAGGVRIGPADFFAGFGHEALIAICSLLVIGRGLTVTGALEPVARLLVRFWRLSPSIALLAVLVVCLALSGFLNDTPIVVLMIPLLLGIAAKTGRPVGPMLMPMNFGVLIGGMATTIGTSTNLLVVAIARDLDVAHFHMFDFTAIVAIAAIPALLYLWLIAPRLLAHVKTPDLNPSLREFEAVLSIPEGSWACGKTLREVLARIGGEVKVTRVQSGRVFLARLPTVVIEPNDRIYVSATAAALKNLETVLGGRLYHEAELCTPVDASHPLSSTDQQLAEVVITEDSQLAGRTLREVRFAENDGMTALAVMRRGDHEPARVPPRDMRFAPGDVLLVQGPKETLQQAKLAGELLFLEGSIDLPRTRKAPTALFIMGAVILCVTTQVLPVAVASLAGALAMLVTGCVRIEGLGAAIRSEIVLLVAASLALGKAMTVTGGADLLASLLTNAVHGAPPIVVVAGVMALMALLTNFVSNNAAAAIGTPIAASLGADLGVEPQTMILAVLFGCNLCFATPMGYQTNLLVMGAAGYRFGDFVRVGLPLVILMIITLSLVLTDFF